jgi:hypothetical protein
MDYIHWKRSVLKYAFYEAGDQNPLDMKCVVAISKCYAVTYAHRSHAKLVPRFKRPDGSIGEGDKLTVYPLKSKSTRVPIITEVVHVDSLRDFIILEARKGTTFFKEGFFLSHNFIKFVTFKMGKKTFSNAHETDNR